MTTPNETTLSPAPDLDAVVRKVAWRLIPILFLAYVINFIDRINISFAKLQMGQALGLDDVAFGIGAGMFFIGYFFFEVPSNMILERLGARRWVPAIMVFWGTATAALAFVTTPLEFYVVRFLIGFAEAGFFPGIVLFMTYWFPVSHRGRMMAVFMMALAIAGVVGGPICGAIMQHLDGYAGWAGWQWLMVVTGLPALLVGVAIYYMITDHPDEASWLTDSERNVLLRSLGNAVKPVASLRDGFFNFWSWNGAWIFFLIVCGGYGMSFWLPTLLQRAGVASASEVGWLVAIPNFVGAMAMILFSRSSDRRQERRWHLTACFGLGALGFMVVAANPGSVAAILIGMSIASAGVMPAVPLSWTVPTRMLAPSAAAVGIAIIASVGNLGGFVAPVLVGKVSVATGSLSGGFWIIAGLLAIGAMWAAVTIRLPPLPSPESQSL